MTRRLAALAAALAITLLGAALSGRAFAAPPQVPPEVRKLYEDKPVIELVGTTTTNAADLLTDHDRDDEQERPAALRTLRQASFDLRADLVWETGEIARHHVAVARPGIHAVQPRPHTRIRQLRTVPHARP